MSPREPAPQPQVRWDTSSLQEVRDVNFCNVAAAPDAFTLLFGSSEGSAGDPEVTVRLRNRVALRPLAARLLRDLLSQQISAYETAHGPISEGYEPLPGSAPLPGSRPRPPLLPPDLLERAALMVELVRGLQAPLEMERSCKLRPGACTARRFLLGLGRIALGPAATIRLPVILKRLGMPEALSAAARAGIAGVDFVHFGFEEDERGAVNKFYLEQSRPLAEILAGRQPPTPVALYTGYKWDPAHARRAAVTRYTAHPLLSAEDISQRIAALLPGAEHSALGTICTDLLALAADRAEASRLLFVEVSDEGDPRASFDLNLYAARLQLGETYPLLAAAARHFAVPRDEFRRIYEEAREHTLGHVSAGLDREGQPFFTFYFGDRSTRA